MKHLLSLAIIFFLPTLLFSQTVVSININGGINPASAEYIHQSIKKAESQKAECLLIHLNTPGGLLNSTRDIVSDFFKSTVPIVVYVSPSGAHAGSAGVFITMAANVAAMAPGTNIGAAHPVSMQGTTDTIMNTKGTNDAAAFIRTIAEKRHRNVKWAEEAVRYSVAITDEEAIQDSVIDYIANDDRELLVQINGQKMEVNGGIKILQTKNASIQSSDMGFFQKVLDKISDPNISYILMMLGFFGLIFEMFNPGAIFPGVAGVIFLVVAFYSMSSMPVNYAGLSLIIFGILLFLLEIKIISHGILTIGGIISLLLGSMFLFRQSPTENIVAVSWGVIISTTLVTSLFFLFIVGMGLKAQALKPVTGADSMIGSKGEAMNLIDPAGMVKINGEMWKAVSISGKINAGERVIVKEIRDLTLYIEQV
ncbi:nodulation protein NfeD [Ginsengibacter hankyongi]|uniref:Nodulation protein NfeD n=1 Tax=Ginsengibacter hankyongi TaxID=2607284 RepID=A0A5J5IL95_9BACT|nr:nodulation protein NfeD [Ginsengibacter hankyongi]KAA9041769.1 nodulation protein NfeD [Ginsengibacter hankyongi]